MHADTPLFTANRGYVAAGELTTDDRVVSLDLPAPAVSGGWSIPVETDWDVLRVKGERDNPLHLPEVWTDEFAHYVGWVIGDGSTSGVCTSTIYGSADDRTEILPRHQDLIERINDGRPLKVSEQANGTAQLRLSRRSFKHFLESLGVASVTGEHKRVPWSIEQAPPEVVASFLRGLFDADGCVVNQVSKGSAYVGLGSISIELLRGTQRLLSTFGISSRIEIRGVSFYTGKDGVDGSTSAADFDLRISARSLERFAGSIGFTLSRKQALLRSLVAERTTGFYDVDTTVRLVERSDEGIELTYNLSEPRNHSYIVNGVVVRNCSEYFHLDNSACNLASINLLKYLDDDGAFDVGAFTHTVDVVFTAQEILVGRADYPTEQIAETTRAFRQLGLGFANLGALLMALGLPYDSDEGRAWAAEITSLMAGTAYGASARIASRVGPFDGYAENEEPMLHVLEMHRDASQAISAADGVPADLVAASRQAWDTTIEAAHRYGVRNSQAVVIAPTGTIGLAMDCDTTGIEPDLSLVKTKKLVGGGTMSIVNQTIPRALRRLGYSPDEVDDIVAYVDKHLSIVGAPHLAAQHVPVFACSMGDNTIHHEGHVRMMAAVQPAVSGGISKTVNVPEHVTVDEIADLHRLSWELGLKSVAIYRDNSKVGQPLSTSKPIVTDVTEAVEIGPDGIVERIIERVVHQPVRQKLPRTRRGKTFEFRVADCKGFATIGEYDNGQPGEIFLTVSKQGSTMAGVMDAFAKSVSYGLQYGVPMRAFVEAFTNMRFEPAGMTDDPDLRFASSIMDYLFRRLALEYMTYDERAELGIFSVNERLQPTLPGVEEAITATSQGSELPPDPKSVPSAGELSMQMQLGLIVPTPDDNTAARGIVRPNDAPMCMQCGVVMMRSGSCFACPSCGNTSGCS